MSHFDRFEFGFPVPGGLSYTPNDGEFLIVNGKGFKNVGPYMAASDAGKNLLETNVQQGYCHRTGPNHYAPTWLGWVGSREALFDLLTSKN